MISMKESEVFQAIPVIIATEKTEGYIRERRLPNHSGKEEFFPRNNVNPEAKKNNASAIAPPVAKDGYFT